MAKKEVKKNKENQLKTLLTTYSKIILTFVIFCSEIQIFCSYVLAYLGREAIAESLSEQVVIVIIGGLIPYFAKSLIENLSKNTTMFGQNLSYENSTSVDFYDENLLENQDILKNENCHENEEDDLNSVEKG